MVVLEGVSAMLEDFVRVTLSPLCFLSLSWRRSTHCSAWLSLKGGFAPLCTNARISRVSLYADDVVFFVAPVAQDPLLQRDPIHLWTGIRPVHKFGQVCRHTYSLLGCADCTHPVHSTMPGWLFPMQVPRNSTVHPQAEESR